MEKIIKEEVDLIEEMEVNENIRGGVPVLRGTRFPVARILADVADGCKLSEIAKDYDQDLGKMRKFMKELAMFYSSSFIE